MYYVPVATPDSRGHNLGDQTPSPYPVSRLRTQTMQVRAYIVHQGPTIGLITPGLLIATLKMK